ncbi:leucyl/phenylalanyl-tRNA--protein transferase [Campylobacter sp. MIT 21-1685]|uniref:leucyl/phenylalanyl-tRNA--protein transferase n=1 Tax=unclassified Campylobacter TaxID=2593542 RepID=UPI00224A58D5|nr:MULTISPECIES: leucyl/phenylalanyl-tRNA--protein transferase [unclassified Campylobacter]MCX2682425.1 leucyl/phenylalanyl-tRNA--protein transferase [Campylobacter sp. MIT 21-1684]MCX2750705.1 leucyl/phenylalanyl-tRNA--protein transferase [Campylobacter sp. MIT 21-1682]MCX2806747.1 leucyl/phenylalanyl-tRNA--protein transferase [Campylobacter sp. MIT 21-1685]
MDKSNFYSELLKAPYDAPVFLSPTLKSDFIIQAYTFGLFPWTSNPVTWWCPDPRCILMPHQIHIQKNMKKQLTLYTIKLDTNFSELITLCKEQRKYSWINTEFITIYTELFEQGYAHSLELYENNKMIGGIYGLIIGKVFFGESMVSLKKNASKVALIKLCQLLAPYDFFIDCQVYNKHLEFMGAKNISRKDFLALLEKKCQEKSGFTNFKTLL